MSWVGPEDKARTHGSLGGERRVGGVGHPRLVGRAKG